MIHTIIPNVSPKLQSNINNCEGRKGLITRVNQIDWLLLDCTVSKLYLKIATTAVVNFISHTSADNPVARDKKHTSMLRKVYVVYHSFFIYFTYQTHCPLLGSYIISSHPSLFHLNISFCLLSFRVSLLTLRADQGEDRVTEMHVNDLKALIDSSQGRDRGRGKKGEKSESGGREEEGTC